MSLDVSTAPATDEIALSTPELEALSRALHRRLVREPLGDESLAAAGLAHLTPRLGPLAGLTPELGERISAAILAERRRPAGADVQLVWTGPEAVSGTARDTATVVRELFGRARKSVLVAGYAFDHGAEILAPLHAVMQGYQVETRIFVDIPRSDDKRDAVAEVARWAEVFFCETWRFPLRPTLYFDPRAVTREAYSSLHAKCIVVDERHALVTSANFTDRGQGRNVEVGVLIDDPTFGRALVAQWVSAEAARVFVDVEKFSFVHE